MFYRIRFALHFWRKMRRFYTLRQALNYPLPFFQTAPERDADAEIDYICN